MISRYAMDLCESMESLLTKALFMFITVAQKLNQRTLLESGRN